MPRYKTVPKKGRGSGVSPAKPPRPKEEDIQGQERGRTSTCEDDPSQRVQPTEQSRSIKPWDKPMTYRDRQLVTRLFNEYCRDNTRLWKPVNKEVSLKNGFRIICYLLSQKARWRAKFGDIDPRKASPGPRSKKWQSRYKFVQGLFEADPRYARQYMEFVGDETADPAKAQAFAEAAALYQLESLSSSAVTEEEETQGPDVTKSVRYQEAVRQAMRALV